MLHYRIPLDIGLQNYRASAKNRWGANISRILNFNFKIIPLFNFVLVSKYFIFWIEQKAIISSWVTSLVDKSHLFPINPIGKIEYSLIVYIQLLTHSKERLLVKSKTTIQASAFLIVLYEIDLYLSCPAVSQTLNFNFSPSSIVNCFSNFSNPTVDKWSLRNSIPKYIPQIHVFPTEDSPNIVIETNAFFSL